MTEDGLLTWTYRVIRRTDERIGEDTYAIYEVYLDEEGRMQSCTSEPVEAHGDSLNELMDDLIHQLRACILPVVDWDSIPEEGARPLLDGADHPRLKA